MTRLSASTALAAALLLAAVAPWAAGQTGPARRAAPLRTPSAAAKPAVPRAMRTQEPVVTATEVVRVANAVAHSLATAKRIPAGQSVALSDGSARSFSPAQLFVLLSRFLGNGYEKGVTPETVPLPPNVGGPLAASPPSTEATKELVVATADLLAQARATADIAESTGNLPTAVWVAGLRLTPAQFMGGLATVLQHAAAKGAAPQSVAIGAYLPPLDWGAVPTTGGPSVPAGLTPLPKVTPQTSPLEGVAPVVSPASAAAAPPATPRLTVYVPVKPPLSGEVPLTVEYEGPAAFVRLSIDGRARSVSNVSRFIYVWDTRLEPDGNHALRVVAVDAAEQTLEKVEANLATVNGNVPLQQKSAAAEGGRTE